MQIEHPEQHRRSASEKEKMKRLPLYMQIPITPSRQSSNAIR